MPRGSLRQEKAICLHKPKLMRLFSAISTALLAVAGTAAAAAPFYLPYISDADTFLLLHLDETAGSGTAGFEGTSASVTGAYTVNNTAAAVTDVTGSTGYFGNAANLSIGGNFSDATDRAIGFDTSTPTNGFSLDAGDEVAFSDILGGNGQFTLEALVRPSVSDFADAGHIWSMDSGTGDRGFQFRINNAEQLEWNPINLGGSQQTFSVGTITPDAWYHVAITYDNGDYTLYWTPLAGGFSEAQVLGTWTSPITNAGVTAELVLGNEGRSTFGMNEAFPGLIDEARVSTTARTAQDFIFHGVTVAGSTGAWEPANPPSNTLDGDLETRASAAGDGSSITYEISGGPLPVESIAMAFYNGDSRVYLFDVLVSTDNSTWTTALSGATSSGTSLELEQFDLPGDPVATYVRIVAHGYNGDVNAFNSYTEVVINDTHVPAVEINPDSDDDGLPDDWETANIGSLSENAYDDHDGDGANNLEELIAGTSPDDVLDYPLWESPRLSLVQDSTVTTNAHIFAAGATYGRAINGISYQDQILLSHDGYQYTGWYDHTTLTVFLARRTVSGITTGAWDIVNTGSAFINGVGGDAHNVITLGICEDDGTLHMAWDHHGHNLRYRKSVAGLCTTNKAAWGPGMMNAEQDWLVAPGQTITSVTYPLFISTPDGDLVLQWRNGGSGAGNNRHSIYNGTTGTWGTPIQIDTQNGTYVEGGFTSTSRNAYLNGLDFGPDGSMHLSWTYREGAGTSNHDICYAYSTDLGVTWLNNDGDLIADTSIGGRISLTSPGIQIKRKNLNQLLINQQTQCVDPEGRVHVMVLHRREDPGYQYPNYSAAAYSINGTAYYHYFRDPLTGAWTQRRIPPVVAPVGSRPRLGYDADGNLYAAFLTCTNRGDLFPGYRGGQLAIATASKDSSYSDWEVVYLSETKFNGEPLLDQRRLEDDGILSIFIQEDTTSGSADGTPLHVIDFTTSPVSDADTDADLLFDSWEIARFGDLATGNVDSDGDGSVNALEMVRRTDPSDSSWRPTKARLEHRWSFNGNLTDSVGSSDAAIIDVGANDVTLGASDVTLTGGAKASSDYVQLGTNLLNGRAEPVTIELWATQNQVQAWSRIFDFNLNTDENLFMSWSIGTDGNSDRVAWKQSPDGETGPPNGSNAPYILGTPYHIVMTITPGSDTLTNGSTVTVYSATAASPTLGEAQASFETPYHLTHLNDVVNALGWSPWPDSVASASYDEVRIWKGALTPAELELHHSNGPDLIIDPDDTDSDGMWDAWEIASFGDLSQTAGGDFDFDGTSNLDELRLGLDPTNPNSRFALSSTDADPFDGHTFSWPSQPGLTFLIEFSSSLSGWTPLEASHPADAGSTTTYTDTTVTPGDLKRFYRVSTNP